MRSEACLCGCLPTPRLRSLRKAEIHVLIHPDFPTFLRSFANQPDKHARKQAKGVYQDMPLACCNLLAVIAANCIAALLGASDALAVEDRGGESGFATLCHAHLLPQAIVELLQKTTLTPSREVVESRGLGRKVLGQNAPTESAPVQIEDRVEDSSAGVLERVARRT